MKYSVFSELTDTNAVTRSESWESFCARFSKPLALGPEAAHPGWSPAIFLPAMRKKENVVEVSCLCLDYDDGDTLEDTLARFPDLALLYHTSRHHRREKDGKPAVDRFRIVLPLSRPLCPEEYSKLWRAFAPICGRIDPSPKDPGRFWFVPVQDDDARFECGVVEGEDLNVDEWLAAEAQLSAIATRTQPTTPPMTLPDYDQTERRARAYMQQLPLAVWGEGGSGACFKVAIMLCRGFRLSEDEALPIMLEYSDQCSPPWTEQEIRHKMRDAINSGTVPMGYIIDRDDRSPARSDYIFDEEEEQLPTKGFHSLRSMFAKTVEEYSDPEKGITYTTGIDAIDALVKIEMGDTVLFLADTNWGKTHWLINLFDVLNSQGNTAALFSLEDSPVKLSRRLLARRMGVNPSKIRDKELTHRELSDMMRLATNAEESTLVYYKVGERLETLLEKMAHAISQGAKFLLVDYVQRVRTPGVNEIFNSMELVMETLSTFAKGHNATLVMTCQVGRNKDEGKHAGKGTSSFEEKCEVLLFGGLRADGERFIEISKAKEDATKAKVDVPWCEKTAAIYRNFGLVGGGPRGPGPAKAKPRDIDKRGLRVVK